jgi:hypothetical protein
MGRSQVERKLEARKRCKLEWVSGEAEYKARVEDGEKLSREKYLN